MLNEAYMKVVILSMENEWLFALNNKCQAEIKASLLDVEKMSNLVEEKDRQITKLQVQFEKAKIKGAEIEFLEEELKEWESHIVELKRGLSDYVVMKKRLEQLELDKNSLLN